MSLLGWGGLWGNFRVTDLIRGAVVLKDALFSWRVSSQHGHTAS